MPFFPSNPVFIVYAVGFWVILHPSFSVTARDDSIVLGIRRVAVCIVMLYHIEFNYNIVTVST